LDIAHKVADRLQLFGFDPYIASDEQTLNGVKENIFHQLATSEYFVFVDFKREQLVSTRGDLTCRGSLFSHQELALASYLDLPVIAFQEEGVKREDGLMRFLQGNAISFCDRGQLPDLIAETIRARKWRPDWKNELILEQQNVYVDSPKEKNRTGRFFYVLVRNLNPRNIAIDCYAYLEQTSNLVTGQTNKIETIEFKWAGYTQPNAVIGPNAFRNFDAFWVYHDDPTKLHFSAFTDSSFYVPQIQGPGDFELSYYVISRNFPVARGTFNLHLGTSLEEINFICTSESYKEPTPIEHQ
jgi:hypothetical protein